MQTKEGFEKEKITRLQTKERRKFQVCRVYEVKIDKSSLSKFKLDYLSRLFLEAKWWYNHVLNSLDNIVKLDCKTKNIQVMNKDKQFEVRELSYGDLKLVENEASTQMFEYFRHLSKFCSVKQEEPNGGLNWSSSQVK